MVLNLKRMPLSLRGLRRFSESAKEESWKFAANLRGTHRFNYSLNEILVSFSSGREFKFEVQNLNFKMALIIQSNDRLANVNHGSLRAKFGQLIN